MIRRPRRSETRKPAPAPMRTRPSLLFIRMWLVSVIRLEPRTRNQSLLVRCEKSVRDSMQTAARCSARRGSESRRAVLAPNEFYGDDPPTHLQQGDICAGVPL